jgi:hypothetical protein
MEEIFRPVIREPAFLDQVINPRFRSTLAAEQYHGDKSDNPYYFHHHPQLARTLYDITKHSPQGKRFVAGGAYKHINKAKDNATVHLPSI